MTDETEMQRLEALLIQINDQVKNPPQNFDLDQFKRDAQEAAALQIKYLGNTSFNPDMVVAAVAFRILAEGGSIDLVED